MLDERHGNTVAYGKGSSLTLGITPTWIEDLLGLWAASDTHCETRKLGWDGATTMFQLWGVVDSSSESDGSYSSAEVAALRAAVERLSTERPDMYEAVLASFKPWTGLVADARTHALVIEAGPIIARWVDEIVD